MWIAVLFVGALVGLVALVWWVVGAYGNIQEKNRAAGEAAYRQSLDALKGSPNDPELRARALALGRYYALLTRQQPHIVPYDEVALANDIAAATAGASATRAVVAPPPAAPASPRSPLVHGNFQATISGDVQAVVTGQATFSVTRNENGTDICAVLLKADSQGSEHSLMFSNALPQAPSPGQYGLGSTGPSSFVGLYSIRTPEGRVGSYSAENGRLDVMASGPVHIQGTFEMAGTGVQNLELWAVEGRARVFGAFDAARIADVCAVEFPD